MEPGDRNPLFPACKAGAPPQLELGPHKKIMKFS